jgi:hypothetical protein
MPNVFTADILQCQAKFTLVMVSPRPRSIWGPELALGCTLAVQVAHIEAP